MQRFALGFVLAMSTTAGSTIAGEAGQGVPVPEDRFLWLEDVTGAQVARLGPRAKRRERKVLVTPEEVALEKRILDILDSKERIPDVRQARAPTTTTSGATRRTRAGSGAARRSTSTASPSPPGRP